MTEEDEGSVHGRLAIDDVQPVIGHGEFPAKAVVNEVVPVAATIWREGHDKLSASLYVRRPGGKTSRETMTAGSEADTFHALITPDTTGMWSFKVEAWSDPLATWEDGLRKKIAAGQELPELNNEVEIGARLFDRAAANAANKGTAEHRGVLERAAAELRGTGTALLPNSATTVATTAAAAHTTATAAAAAGPPAEEREILSRTAFAFSSEVHQALAENPLRELVTPGQAHRLWVDRTRAQYNSWYEFFPRSTGGWDADGRPRHGTFTSSHTMVDHASSMGFDVLYLPPIHPIGHINRKGRNNALTPEPTDVGSPWAIGSAEGGHDAIHPELGTEADFADFVAYTREKGMEVALDLALQCAPDHPWAEEHPEWFTVLPDGHIAFAENPPKKYEDIYPINFDLNFEGIYTEVLRVVRVWMERGVRIFRVDNPHTKPVNFWHRLIAEIKASDPDVLFLAEAFTRRARLYGLAKRGFSQSYTYFTWKVAKWELEEFSQELVRHADVSRPNLFTNTPDILHESLQRGGPEMFAIRAALAATMSPSWGVYSGFELFEWEPVKPGSEEYLDSEKYELRPRDFAGAQESGHTLIPWITTLNRIRRAHPALQQLRTLRLHAIDNDNLIAYSKVDLCSGDTVLAIINLNPHGAEEGTIHLDMPALGYDWGAQFTVFDEVTGSSFHWGQENFVRLEPWNNVAHIVTIPPGDVDRRRELSFREMIVK